MYDLLLRYPRLQLLLAKEGLPHLQKEIPLGVFGEIYELRHINIQQWAVRIFSAFFADVKKNNLHKMVIVNFEHSI